MVEDPHTSMEFLFQLIGQLDDASKLSPKNLGATLREEAVLVFVEVSDALGSGDGYIHDRLQSGVLNVREGHQLGLL